MRRLLPTILFMSLAVSAEAQVLYVDADAPPGGDGLGWVSAFNDLTVALALAPDSAEIRIAEGIYRPGQGKIDRLATFSVGSGVSILGGYAGLGAIDPDHRNPEMHLTRLSGDLLGDDAGEFAGYSENSYTVIGVDTVALAPTIDGLVIEHGLADSFGSPLGMGGGLSCIGSDLIVRDCHFIANAAVDRGAGIWFDGPGSLECDGCVFTGNRVFHDDLLRGEGGAIAVGQASALVLNGCSLASNAARSGGGISASGVDVTAVDCSFVGHETLPEIGDGAVANLASADVEFLNCSFSKNFTSRSMLHFSNTNHVVMDGCQITGNDGGLINIVEGSLEMNDCVVEDNHRYIYNGPLIFVSVDVVFSNSSFVNNSTIDFGGVIYAGDGDTVVVGCSFVGNESVRGGAIYCFDGIVCSDSEFTGNHAELRGGAVCLNGSAAEPGEFTNCEFIDNSAGGSGGGFYSQLDLTVVGCVFSGNQAGAGGGAFADYDTVHVEASSFVGNSAMLGGGLLTNSALPCVVDCEFRENQTTGSGGGLFLAAGFGEACVSNCGFYDNSALGYGGGAELKLSSDIERCVFSGNTAARGGGLKLESLEVARMVNCSVWGNTAAELGGGVWFEEGAAELCSSILWGNSGPQSDFEDQITGENVTITYSCLEGLPPALEIDGNIAEDPLFVDATDEDFSLSPGSPCINAGDPFAPLDPDGTPLDMGAVPYTGPLPGPEFVRADCNGDSILDLADGVFLLWQMFGAGPPSSCVMACDLTGDGVVDLGDALFNFAWQLLDGPAPGAPYPECGTDPTGSDLPCFESPCGP